MKRSIGRSAAAAALAAWLIPRRVAGARYAVQQPAVVIDILPVLVAGALLLIASGRPMFSGIVLLALGGGFALADHTQAASAARAGRLFGHVRTRTCIHPPPSVLAVRRTGARHWRRVGGNRAGIAVLMFSPALWQTAAAFHGFLLLVTSGAGWLLSREPLLGIAAARLRRFQPTGEPLADAARLGPFAVLLVYGIIARAERAERRASSSPVDRAVLRNRSAATPVVLVQCESFFDARRVSSRVPRHLLAAFDACVQQGATYGRLEISAWGANTMRAEFAALTGIPEQQLGYDRFNPYHAFARAPLASLASRLRDEGYRTICLHPFDKRFFRRDLAMPALGFDKFLGRETLGGSRRPPYRSDPELARQIVRVLDAEGPRTFIFAITMGNHGPWSENGAAIDPVLERAFDTADVPQGRALLRYLAGLSLSDEMLAILLEELGPGARNALFGFYGDHQPSLPDAFDYFGFDDWASDYVLVGGAPSHHAPRRSAGPYVAPDDHSGIAGSRRDPANPSRTARRGLTLTAARAEMRAIRVSGASPRGDSSDGAHRPQRHRYRRRVRHRPGDSAAAGARGRPDLYRRHR